MKKAFTILFFTGLWQVQAQSPGGVSGNLNVWLRADVGTSTTTDGGALNTWLDQSGNANHATQDGNPPAYRHNFFFFLNYNPVVDFDGANDRLALNLNTIKNNDYSLIAVGRRDNANFNVVLGSPGGTGNQSLHFGYRNATAATLAHWGNDVDVAVTNWNTPRVSPFILTGQMNSTGRLLEELRDGSFNRNTDNSINYLTGTGANYIGDLQSVGNYDGSIAEVIVYNRYLTLAERQKIYSYLALKHGIALTADNDKDGMLNEVVSGAVHEGDYVASNGTVIWNYANNGAAYYNNLAGIGRDDGSGLVQKQSANINANGILAIGLGTISTSNASNPNSFVADKSFLVWGDNAGGLTFSASGAPAQQLKVGRTWRVQETGNVGTVTVRIPGSTSGFPVTAPVTTHLHLLVDADDDFTTGATVVPMTLVSGFWEASVNLANGDHFTMARYLGAELSATTQGHEQGPVNVVFTVNLNRPNTTGSAVTFDIDDLGTGTAIAGTDYMAIPGTAKISVANGATTGTYSVTVLNDALRDGNKTLNVAISNSSSAEFDIATATATAEIYDNEYAPGLLSNGLVFWLKADAGTNTTVNGASVTSWTDQSGKGNNATNSGTWPLYSSVWANYNPALDFSPVNGGFTIGNNNEINIGSHSQKSYSIAFRTGSDVSTRQLIYEEGGGSNGLNLYITGGRLYTNLWVSNADNANSAAITANTDYVLTFVYNGPSSRWDSYLNGALSFSDAGVPTSLPSHSGAIGLGVIVSATQYHGGQDVNNGDDFKGQIMEMAYYNTKALTTTERNRLESYLAVKYGIALQGNYEASDGTNIWSTAANSGYVSGITGLGHEANEPLVQKQAGVQLSGNIVAMGVGTVAASNAANANSFAANKSYMLWGHNGGTTGFTGVGAPAGKMIMARQWKVQETGTVGAVKVVVPAFTSPGLPKVVNTTSLKLLVDADGDFTSGATTITMTKVGTNWECSHDFTTGQYFTFSFSGALVSAKVQGDEAGPIHIVYKISLPTPNASGSTLNYAIADNGTGTATSGADYVAIPGSAKFQVPDGDSTATFTVTVLDDVFDELTETVIIAVGNSGNPLYTVGNSLATAYIYDDDETRAGGLSIAPTFWLRADDSTSTKVNGAAVSFWYDKSANAHDGTTGATPPVFRAVSSNFNPAVDFSGSAIGYLIADANDINVSSSTAKSYCIAFSTGADINTLQQVYEQGGTANGMNLYIENGNLKLNWWAGSTEEYGFTPIQPNTTYVCTYVYDGPSGRWDLYLNGAQAAFDAFVPGTLPGHSGDVGLGYTASDTQVDGGRDLGDGQPFTGSIMEMIYYHQEVLSTNQRARLETYLCLKYAVQCEANLLAADGTTTVWDATANLAYQHHVAGLAGDGKSGLVQKQTYTATNRDILAVGLGSIEVSNATNTAQFLSGKDFLIWGHNNAKLEGVTTNASLPAQSGVVDRLARTWKIEETGTVDSVLMAFFKDSVDNGFPHLGLGQLYLRVADDAALTLNAVDVPTGTGLVLGQPCYTVYHDFSGSQYFTLVQKDFILWDSTEWRGGLSALAPHSPSSDSLDRLKPMYIRAGDTATLAEGAFVNTATIDLGATLVVAPATSLTVNGIANQGSLLLQADSSGFGQYKGPAVAGTFQQYIDDEGWHLIGSPFSDATFGDFTFLDDNGFINHPLGGTSQDSCTYCNLWWYDASTDNGTDIGHGSSDAFGTWRSSASAADAFTPTRGYNLYLDAASGFANAPWTLSVAGTFNNGPFSQQVNENNAGWNLVANPYPSAISWDAVDDGLPAAGLATGYHIWDSENTNYAVYDGGVGTYGLTGYIAPFQGFFVQTAVAGAQNSGDVFHSFDLENSDRPDVGPNHLGNFYKAGETDKILLRSRHLTSGKIDETIIRFSETGSPSFDPAEDIRKLFTRYKDVPSLFSKSGGGFAAISTVPYPVSTDSLLIGIRTNSNSQLILEMVEAPAGYTVYLEDLKTGKWHRIDRHPYVFVQDNGLRERFWLHFGPGPITPKNWSANNSFSIYFSANQLVLTTQKNITEGEWYLTTTNGRVVGAGKKSSDAGSTQHIEVGHLPAGAYIFVLMANGNRYAEKIVKL